MSEPTPNDRRQSIDARTRIAKGAVWGAIGACAYFLLFKIPFMWSESTESPMMTVFIIGGSLAFWMALGALAGANRTRELIGTGDHRSLIRRHAGRAALRATCFALPVAMFAFIVNWIYFANNFFTVPVILLILWVGIAAWVGYARGEREVRSMQHRMKAMAEQVDLRRSPAMAQGNINQLAAPGEKIQPDPARLTEASKPHARDPIDLGHED